MYNVNINRVRVTFVALENNKCYIFRVCVSSLNYPANKAHALNYIVICGLPGCTIFFYTMS